MSWRAALVAIGLVLGGASGHLAAEPRAHTTAPPAEVDAVVAGAGLAGYVLSIRYAQAGKRVRLVELRGDLPPRFQRPGASLNTPSGLPLAALRNTAFARSQTLVLGEALVNYLTHEVGIDLTPYLLDRSFKPRRESLTLERLLTTPVTATIRTNELQRLLRARAEAVGVDLQFGARVEAFERRREGTTKVKVQAAHRTRVEGKGGSGTWASFGRPRHVTARWLAAADGVHARLAEKASIRIVDAEDHGRIAAAWYRSDGEVSRSKRGASPVGGEKGSIIYHGKDGVPYALLPVRPGDDGAALSARAAELALEHIGVELKVSATPVLFDVVLRDPDRVVSPEHGFLLVGEAATGGGNPLTGQSGMVALLSAELAARAMIQADRSGRSALPSYEAGVRAARRAYRTRLHDVLPRKYHVNPRPLAKPVSPLLSAKGLSRKSSSKTRPTGATKPRATRSPRAVRGRAK